MATAKKKNNITLYIGLAVLAIGVFLLIKKRKKEQELPQIEEGNQGVGTTTPTPQKCDENKVLKQGMNSNTWKTSSGENCNQIRWAQNKFNALNAKGTIKLAAPLTQDGVFGAKTAAAFKVAMGKPSASWKEIRTKYPQAK